MADHTTSTPAQRPQTAGVSPPGARPAGAVSSSPPPNQQQQPPPPPQQQQQQPNPGADNSKMLAGSPVRGGRLSPSQPAVVEDRQTSTLSPEQADETLEKSSSAPNNIERSPTDNSETLQKEPRSLLNTSNPAIPTIPVLPTPSQLQEESIQKAKSQLGDVTTPFAERLKSLQDPRALANRSNWPTRFPLTPTPSQKDSLLKAQSFLSAERSPSTSDKQPIQEPKGLKSPTCRSVLMFMSFLAFFNVYCLRANLGVAVLAMNNSTLMRLVPGNISRVRPLCKTDRKAAAREELGEFNWDADMQGVVLAAFFYGYILGQLCGGKMARKIGGKLVLLLAVCLSATTTIATPFAVRFADVIGIVSARALVGFGEGLAYPSMHLLLSKWAPPRERSKIVATIYAGTQVGTIFTLPLTGILCHFFNWDKTFYVTGGLAAAWCLFGIFLLYESPMSHPRIDPLEREYILSTQNQFAKPKPETLKVPWDDILRSLPVHATAIAHFASNWSYYTMLTCLPLYFSHVLRFSLINTGLLCGLPFLVMWIAMVIAGLVGDRLITKHTLSTTSVRKLFITLGFLLPAGCLVGVGYVKCSHALSVTLIVIAVGLSGLSMAGWSVNHIDLAPTFASTLVGFTNIVGTVPGIVTPSVVAALTNANHTYEGWRNVFFVLAGIYAFATMFFWIVGSGQRQPWSVYVLIDSDVEPVEKKEAAAPAIVVNSTDTESLLQAQRTADDKP